MDTQEIKNIINQYFDNELTKSEEVILFTQLSQNDEAREYFKEMNLLKTISEESVEEYPNNLDDKIFAQLKVEEKVIQNKPNYSRYFSAISYGLALVLLALSIFFYTESIQYKNKLELTYYQVKQQNEMIQVLFN
ncbi:MAG: hypothetical protein GY936_12230, partial [Ignavibacteriae bacterium]|nr:hypothetical protein [Ignavibacteriota bacterium]